jgi:hypothetical protein
MLCGVRGIGLDHPDTWLHDDYGFALGGGIVQSAEDSLNGLRNGVERFFPEKRRDSTGDLFCCL